MDCFPCATVKRRVELELTQAGVRAEEIVKRVSLTRCAMCTEAERQEARRRARAAKQAGSR